MVGSQVLGAFVYGTYYPSPVLSVVNYSSIVLATFVYTTVFGKFYKANRVAA